MRGRRQAHFVLSIAHFKLFLWSEENTVSGKSFNAVNLGVPSTWPPNCAHIILIHSAETPVWYFINILLFHVKKLFNWFSKYVWYMVAYFCLNSCFSLMIRNKIFEISGWTDTNNERSKDTKVKSQINKVSTNKRS